MAPVTLVYFCYGWTLWMYLNWLPQYFMNEYNLQLSRSALFSAAVFLAGVAGDYLGGEFSDRILHATGSLRKARRDFVIVAFSCSFLFMLPVFFTHNLTLIVLSLAAAFFCAELVDRSDVVHPDGHRAEVLGDGERPDEHGIGHRRRPLTGHLRLHRRLDRQLAAAVHRLAGAAAPRRGDGVHDAPRARLREPKTPGCSADPWLWHAPPVTRQQTTGSPSTSAQKSNWTLIFAKRAVTMVVGTRQPVIDAFE